MAELGKRQMERFNLNVPVKVTPNGRKGPDWKASTEFKTRNVCAGGAFILTDSPFDVGIKVDVDLHLVFFTGSLEHERRSNVHVSGSVVRAESGGMAIKFDDKYQILPAP